MLPCTTGRLNLENLQMEPPRKLRWLGYDLHIMCSHHGLRMRVYVGACLCMCRFTPLSHLSYLCHTSVASLWYLRCSIAVTPLSSICGISVTSLAYTCRMSLTSPSHLCRMSVASSRLYLCLISVAPSDTLPRRPHLPHIAWQTPSKLLGVHPRHAWPGVSRRIGR